MQYLDTEKELQLIKMEKLGINTKGQSFEQMVNTALIMLEENQALSINGVSGMLSLNKFKKEVEAYELEQQTHPIKRTPERMRTILCATYWCKKIAERLTKQ